MPLAMSSEAALALLRWYAEMGVDVAVTEEPVDLLAAPEPESVRADAVEAESPRRVELDIRQLEIRRREIPSAPTAPALLTSSPEAVVLAAREEARSAQTLDALRDVLERFDGCALKATATRIVFGDGAADARIMLVGEAPGRDEDLQGRPFVGRSGQLLDRMLAAIGLDRSRAYIANLVPWRPPGNRTPTPQEAAVCRPFLERQIELVDPDVLVCLGAPSAQALLGVKEGILRARGRWTSFDTGRREVRAMATLHPAYLLRQPVQKRLAWRDFRALEAALETTSPKQRS